MAKKTFELELKDGFKVKTLEELREHFSMGRIIEYFRTGQLVEWLEAMFYEDEAEIISKISTDDKHFAEKICMALDVDCADDLEVSQRLKEKKNFLREKTTDENIIEKAAITALNQRDLADLIHMDCKTIYLCGEIFNVPINVQNMNYIGILSTPKIKIKANSDEELEANNIIIKNCKLSWRKTVSLEELKSLFKKIFNSNGAWEIIGKDGKTVQNYDKLSDNEKAIALKMVFQGKYSENQIVYLRLTEDLTSGFAFTIDSVCFGGLIGNYLFKYKKISKIENINQGISSEFAYKFYLNDIIFNKTSSILINLFGNTASDIYYKIKDYLNVVKNL
ncbi:MAG: hypothetical protein IJ728_05040 [Selenomonadaceae bacterium]|nr:hypothetical protein [Selenomonadaceae bacterium]